MVHQAQSATKYPLNNHGVVFVAMRNERLVGEAVISKLLNCNVFSFGDLKALSRVALSTFSALNVILILSY